MPIKALWSAMLQTHLIINEYTCIIFCNIHIAYATYFLYHTSHSEKRASHLFSVLLVFLSVLSYQSSFLCVCRISFLSSASCACLVLKPFIPWKQPATQVFAPLVPLLTYLHKMIIHCAISEFALPSDCYEIQNFTALLPESKAK